PNEDKRIEVRSARYASAASDFGRSYVTRASVLDFSSAEIVNARLPMGSLFDSCNGIVPSAGSVETVLISSILLTVLSKLSRANASPNAKPRPNKNPSTRLRRTFGEMG